MNDALPSPLRHGGWLGLARQCALLLLAGSIPPLAAAVPPLSAAECRPGGADGQPIPRDLFAATVRVLDEAGQEISIYVIPETQNRGDRLNVDTRKLLGVEGAAIVYRRLFGAL